MSRAAAAVVALAMLATAACSRSVVRTKAVPSTWAPGMSVVPTPCPQRSPLTRGSAVIIDYVDFVKVHGSTFLNSQMATQQPPPRPAGRVVARVRCNLQDAPTDRGGPPQVDGTAAFLPVGTVLTAAAGVPSSCELLARVDGRVRTYLVQVDSAEHSTVSTCWRNYASP